MWLSRFESWPGSPVPASPGSDRRIVNTQPEVGEPPRTASLVAVVLAAGQGTRMRSSRHKVLHLLGGKPLIQRVLDLLEGAGRNQCRRRARTRAGPGPQGAPGIGRYGRSGTPVGDRARRPGRGRTPAAVRRRSTPGALRRRSARSPRQPAASHRDRRQPGGADRIAERACARPERLRTGHSSAGRER